MHLLDWFTHLPRVTQCILLVSILALLVIVAFNHTAESNIADLLLVVLAVAGVSKKRNKSE